MPHLSNSDFRRLHEKHIHSVWWTKTFAPAARDHYRHKCARCGKRGWIVDHKKYRLPSGELIFGKETFGDVRLLCSGCNKKGVRSDYAISQDRQTLLVIRLVDRLFGLGWAFCRALIRIGSRSIKRLYRG